MPILPLVPKGMENDGNIRPYTFRQNNTSFLSPLLADSGPAESFSLEIEISRFFFVTKILKKLNSHHFMPGNGGLWQFFGNFFTVPGALRRQAVS